MRHIVAFSLQRRPLVILLFFTFIVIGLVGFRQAEHRGLSRPGAAAVVVITQNPGPERRGDRALHHRSRSRWRWPACRTWPRCARPACSASRSSRRSSPSAYNYDQSLQQVLNRLGQIDPAGRRAAADLPLEPDRRDHALPHGRPARLFAGRPRVLQDWVLHRRFKRVPGVIDVTSLAARPSPTTSSSTCRKLNGLRPDPAAGGPGGAATAMRRSAPASSLSARRPPWCRASA